MGNVKNTEAALFEPLEQTHSVAGLRDCRDDLVVFRLGEHLTVVVPAFPLEASNKGIAAAEKMRAEKPDDLVAASNELVQRFFWSQD